MYGTVTYKVTSNFDTVKLTGFQWDEGNLDHIRKHGVEYSECEEVFLNKSLIILFDEKHSKSEGRFKVFGVSSGGRKLALAITIRKNKIRVVTARDQNRKEKLDLGGEIK